MANNKECAVCKEMMKKKHRFDKFFKIGFFIILALFIVVVILYCCNGNLFKQTEVSNSHNDNSKEINIDNGGDNNNFIVGDGDGCYIISQGNN